MNIGFVSLFPETMRPFLESSVLGRAVEGGRVAFTFANPRDFAHDRHRKVDDAPYGGAPGMLIRPEPAARAIEHLRRETVESEAIVALSPAGERFGQGLAREWSRIDRLIFLCGHYEGYDHRVEQKYATHTVSLGDFVLTNGELPALAMADAVVRLLPGVLGNPESLEADSLNGNLLGPPNFTRPEVWEGMEVPADLRSGNHAAVSRWQRAQALEATRRLRPDLFARARLEKGDANLLDSLFAPDDTGRVRVPQVE